MELTKKLFDELTFEEDFVIECVCDECGHVHKDEVFNCNECGSEELLNETSHEGMLCSICGGYIDMWTDLYVNGDIYVCENCYDNFELEANKKQTTEDFISEYYKHNPSAN